MKSYFLTLKFLYSNKAEYKAVMAIHKMFLLHEQLDMSPEKKLLVRAFVIN